MNNKYKKKYLKYKKKYLKFKKLRGGAAAAAPVNTWLKIALAGGLFFALSSSLFLDKFSLQPGLVNYSLKIKDITDFFQTQLRYMKDWHTRTGGEGVAPKGTKEDFSGFPWNNETTMIRIFGENFSSFLVKKGVQNEHLFLL